MTLSVAVAHRFAQFSLDAAFSAPTPGVTALFGPSGAGKSSLLAAIAGLSRPDRCQVDLDGLRLSDLPAPKRRIGLVFQDARLFPHLSVAGNLRYGQRRAPPGAIDFDAVVALLGIAHLLPRRPSSLSGGEAQRVAIGRALLAQPRLLLMDEPLSALDAARRDELLPYLAGLRALRLPILYVSHALEEVLRLAETLVLIAEGRILAAGPPEALCARPDLPLARGEDAAGILAGTLRGHWRDRGISEIACGRERLLVPFLALPLGTAVRLRVPAREIILALAPPDAISVNNVLAATIQSITPAAGGAAVTVELATGAGALLARVTAFAAQRLALQPGGAVYALVKSMSVTAVSQA